MAEKKLKKTPKKTVQNRETKQRKPSKSAEFLGLNDGLTSLFTLVGGILLCVFYYFPEGFFGPMIRDFSLGLFGWPVYLLPILLIVNGIHKSSKNYETHKAKYIYITVGLAVLSVFSHIVLVPKENPLNFTNIATYFKLGANSIGGGLFGGFIAYI